MSLFAHAAALLFAALLAASACRKQEPKPIETPSAPAPVSVLPGKPPVKTTAAKPSAKTASLPAQQPCDEAAAAVETGKPSNVLLSEEPTCAAGAPPSPAVPGALPSQPKKN